MASVYFQDNFESGNANNWTVARNMQWNNQSEPCYFKGQPASWEVKNGRYGIAIDGKSCVTETMPIDQLWDDSWNNYIFESDITFIDGVDANIAFRYSDDPNFDWYGYHFQVNATPNNSRVILQRVWNSHLYSDRTSYTLTHGNTYHLKIIVDKEHIQIYIDDLLVLDYPDAGGRFTTGRIALQASVGSVNHSEVWFDNVVVRSIEEDNVPVVVVPGFGGSWNTTALITGGDAGTWKKTPFIKVYDNLRNTFLNNGYTENDDYFEFYYDWRDSLDDLADVFKDYLENTVLSGKSAGTKVNIVGHSMGGLVARAYMQKYGESKVSNIVTAGSPHEGTVPAWHGWAGAEVGDRWSWQWIALQLYLQIHKDNYTSPILAVHDLSPSLKELQPTFDFAKNSQDQVIDLQDMSDFNNYLLGLNSTLENSLKNLMTTIAGINNANSIEWVKLKDRSLTDRLLSKWPDGRPDTYEYTSEGDLTVLKTSALVDDTTQVEVSNTHQEMVQSEAGIQAIIDGFGLGISPVTGSNEPNRNPALIFFLHSPANIRVTAPDGSQAGHGVASPLSNAIYSAEDKLLVIYDALDGDYQVEVIGNDSGSYSLELGQLTVDGEEWDRAKQDITSGEVDSYTLRFNSSDPLDYPLVDSTGKMQLEQARKKLNDLEDYINSQSFSTADKRQLTRYISRLVKMINRAIIYIDANNYSRAYRYARAAMTGCYSLRMKVDRLSRIDENIQVKIKALTHQIGTIILEGYVAALDRSGRGPGQVRVNREVSMAERVKGRVENRVQSTSGENHALGRAFELSEEMLYSGQNAVIDGEFSRASAQVLLSRLLSLEAFKLNR